MISATGRHPSTVRGSVRPEWIAHLGERDHGVFERLALRALRACGLTLTVRLVRGGEQALRALGLDESSKGRTRKPPDLVISDLKMPKGTGIDALAGDIEIAGCGARSNSELTALPSGAFARRLSSSY